jgi:hypothetical protein
MGRLAAERKGRKSAKGTREEDQEIYSKPSLPETSFSPQNALKI